jgi:hypothetical protein
MTTLPLTHLIALTTPLGVHEHALGAVPREEHGYCTDDVARALRVVVLDPEPDEAERALARGYLGFLVDAAHDDGSLHNRRNPDGTWGDESSTGDHWGRAVHALGTVAARATDPQLAARARGAARAAMAARSAWPRSMAYAALGAAEVLAVSPDDLVARRLVMDARRLLRPAGPDEWPWPEPALHYANAVIPEAMIVLGRLLDSEPLRRDGLRLLRWLVDIQTLDGHLSVVPAGGRRPGETGPAFDQQPIEAGTLAEACATALAETGDPAWLDAVGMCAAWFEGDNDIRLPMRDPVTGAGFDGLEPTSVNRNQGAESTLAWLRTLQMAAATGLVAA